MMLEENTTESKLSGGVLAYIGYLNMHCNIHNLISYFKVAVMRAFYESILSYFLYQTFVLFTMASDSHPCNGSPKSALASLLLLPLFLIFVACFIYVGFYVWVVCKTIVDTLYIDKTEQPNMIILEKAIYKTIKMTHRTGVGIYCGISIITALVFHFTNVAPVESLLHFLFFSGLAGLMLGGLWNLTDWYSDNRIDWSYMIKGYIPIIEKYASEIYKHEIVSVESQIASKFKFFKYHVLMLSISSFIVIGLACICFITGAQDLNLDASFFGNVYVVFFSSICFLFFRSCYTTYFKNEERDKKIYPHLTEFPLMKNHHDTNIK